MSDNERIFVVTGASTGIGRATAEALARTGARVVLVSRHEKRLNEAKRSIGAACGHDRVEMIVADLSAQSEVRALAEKLDRLPRLDALINNAGGFYAKRQTTADGREMTLALNHLSPLLLTRLCLDVLRRSAPSRVVNLSSRFKDVPIRWSDLDLASNYRPLRAYAQAKLASLMTMVELAGRTDPREVAFHAVHPGDVNTDVAQNSGLALRSLYRIIAPLFFLTPERGADSVVWAATSPEVAASGRLWHRRCALELPAACQDAAQRTRMWSLSVDAT